MLPEEADALHEQHQLRPLDWILARGGTPAAVIRMQHAMALPPAAKVPMRDYESEFNRDYESMQDYKVSKNLEFLRGKSPPEFGVRLLRRTRSRTHQ